MLVEAIEGDNYFSLKGSSQGSYKEKGSKFLAFAYEVSTVEEAMEYLNILKTQYHDARHHCFAYRIDPEKPEVRISDDGEPGNSAGTPIYNQLLSANLYNAMVVVVRYFGGTKLGVPGLVHAYKTAAADALRNNTITERFLTERFQISFPYNETGDVMQVLKSSGAGIVQEAMSQNAGYVIEIRKSLKNNLFTALKPFYNVKIT